MSLRATTPTVRAAALLAAIGVAAFVIPSWLAIGVALALAAATAADAYAVREAPAIERRVGAVIARGVAAPLSVRVRPPDGRHVRLRQAPAPDVEIAGDESLDALDTTLVAARRGRYRLPGVWSASLGPLGLASVRHPPGADAELRVYPDVITARRLIVRLRRSRAGDPGGIARGPLGLGTEFESVRDYSVDDDIRALNWRATARLGRPMSNQYRVERDQEVVCLIDCGRLMAAPIGARTLLDAALDAFTVIALAADELGDRFGAVAFDDGLRHAIAPAHLGGRRAIELLFDLRTRPIDSDFERALARVGRARRGLVFIHTDLIDEAAARSLLGGVAMLVRRHAVVVASAADPILSELAGDDGDHEDPERLARRVVALDMLEARRRATVGLRHAGAHVLEAPGPELAERCLQAYISAKRRARL